MLFKEQVKVLQGRLKDANFYQGDLDGLFGPVSLQAIMSALDMLKVSPATKARDPQPEPKDDTPPPSAPSKPNGKAFVGPAPTRKVHTAVVHCTATPEGKEFTRAQINSMHVARGFQGIGYHYLVHLDGRIEAGRPEGQIGAHVAGHNKDTIGLSYVGGVDANGKPKDTRTEAQKQGIRTLLTDIHSRYKLKAIKGHRDFSPDKDHDGVVEPSEWIKFCPCFDAIPEYVDILK